MDIIIRPMDRADLQAASIVHEQAFSRQKLSFEWLECNLNGYPRFFSYVAEYNASIIGYIHWGQKSGFRKEVVLELEQIAVLPVLQSKGVGRQLIRDSLPLVERTLARRQASIKHIMVTTRADNKAQQLYKSELGAEVEAKLTNLYSADEVVMVARHYSRESYEV